MSQRLFDLMREELVALMLMIYFRRHWEQDEILQFLDCTGLQKRLANLMEQKLFTNPEICAIILGKKLLGVIFAQGYTEWFSYFRPEEDIWLCSLPPGSTLLSLRDLVRFGTLTGRIYLSRSGMKQCSVL